jgi:type II secretory pathway pseudopilin PulG
MTLVEVMVALVILGLTMTAIVSGYIFSVKSAEMSALSLAANARAQERLEQTRSAIWKTTSFSPLDQVMASNFPNQTVVLDLSGSGTGITYATNFTQISQISANPPLKRVRVDCVWAFQGGRVFTNTLEDFRCPDP